jgi:hypothetical protein
VEKSTLALFLVSTVAALGALLFARRANASEDMNAPRPTVQPSLPLPTLSAPRGIRNNNPTNIVDDGTAWRGRTGSDGRYLVFATPIDGLRAGFINLRSYMNTHGLRSVRAIISRWAPSTENNTEAYILDVVNRTGFGRDQILSWDTHSTDLIRAIVWHENGQNPYTVFDYAEAKRQAA